MVRAAFVVRDVGRTAFDRRPPVESNRFVHAVALRHIALRQVRPHRQPRGMICLPLTLVGERREGAAGWGDVGRALLTQDVPGAVVLRLEGLARAVEAERAGLLAKLRGQAR